MIDEIVLEKELSVSRLESTDGEPDRIEPRRVWTTDPDLNSTPILTLNFFQYASYAMRRVLAVSQAFDDALRGIRLGRVQTS